MIPLSGDTNIFLLLLLQQKINYYVESNRENLNFHIILIVKSELTYLENVQNVFLYICFVAVISCIQPAKQKGLRKKLSICGHQFSLPLGIVNKGINGYEAWQTSKEQTTMPRFRLEGP